MTLREPPYDDTERHLRPVPNGPDDGSTSAQPPADIPAEKALLSALLLEPARAQSIATHLNGADFYQPRNETIWNALQTATADGCTDPTLTHEAVIIAMIKGGDQRHVPYLAELITAGGDPLYLDAYIANVRDASRLRAVKTIATQLGQAAGTGNLEKTDEILARAVDTISEAALRFGPTAKAGPDTGRKDLSWLLTGDWPEPEAPVYGRRQDGHALFYAGRVNCIYGDPEAAKTWLAQVACLEAINAGRLAVVLDLDHNGMRLTVARMLLLGAIPTQLADPQLFRYYEPDDAPEVRAAIADICTAFPAVAVIDSIGELLPILSVKSVDNDEITMALRTTTMPIAATGACVITIDHLPKGTDARNSGYAIGGTGKKRTMRGSFIHAEVVGNLNPAPGQLGKIALRVEKDTIGGVRATCPTKYIGHFIIDSRSETHTKTSITREGLGITPGGEFRPTHLMETVSRLIEDYPECSTKTIEKTIHAKAAHVRVAISRLLEDAYITTNPGPRNATLHTSLKPYREADDEPQD